MKVVTVKFRGKDGFGTPYSYLCEEYLEQQLEVGQWVIVENDRNKYGIGVYFGVSEDQDYKSKSFEFKKVVSTTMLPKENVL
jgi:hypothetical protein